MPQLIQMLFNTCRNWRHHPSTILITLAILTLCLGALITLVSTSHTPPPMLEAIPCISFIPA